MMNKIAGFYIIAGNDAEAREYCHDNNLDYESRRVIDSPARLLDIKNLVVFLIGSHEQREDWLEFLDMLSICNCITSLNGTAERVVKLANGEFSTRAIFDKREDGQ